MLHYMYISYCILHIYISYYMLRIHFILHVTYSFYMEQPDDAAARVAPRPARLGLGAKFIPHSAALNTRDTGAESKLAASIKGQQRKKERYICMYYI
jgi:hypothetical protein